MRQAVKMIKVKCYVSYVGACIKWLCMKGKSFLRVVCKIAWSIVVSYVWLQRNAPIFSGNIKSKETILLMIRRDIKAQVEFVKRENFVTKQSNVNWGEFLYF